MHDSPYFKILNFNFKAGQELPVHSHDIEGQLSLVILEGEGEFKELRRSGTEGGLVVVAQHIDSTNTSCEWSEEEGMLILKITAQVGDRSATRTYKVEPRAFSK